MVIPRGQISTEYLIVVMFVMFVVIGMVGAGFFYASQTRDSIKFSQLASFAQTLTDSAASVFYAGEPAQITVTPYLPQGVTSIVINNSEILFTVSTSSGVSRISYSSAVPIEGTLSATEGVKRIRLTALPSGVLIAQV